KPAFPLDAEYLPTSPVLPRVQTSVPPPTGMAPSGSSFAPSSRGGQSTPPLSLGRSSGASTPARSTAQRTPLPPSQPFPTPISGGQATPAPPSSGIPGSGSFAPAPSPPMTPPP